MRDPDYPARVERVIRVRIEAWDTNCPQHIPLKFDAPDVAAALAARDARIAELEAEYGFPKGPAVSAALTAVAVQAACRSSIQAKSG